MTEKVTLNKSPIRRLLVKIEGETSLICHKWSDKAKKMMLDKQMKVNTKAGREAKDPERDFRESLYHHPDGGYGFPSVGFAAAMARAAKTVQGITMVDVRCNLYVEGDLVKIEGEPSMREDMVRIDKGGTADIRHRGEFIDWKATVPISFNSAVLSADQVINLLSIAGFGVGVGDWRPERNGQHGRFHVVGMQAVESKFDV